MLCDCVSLDNNNDGGMNYNVDEDDDDDNNDDEEGSSILSTLQQLRIDDPTLLIPILDAMSSLPLSEEQITIVVKDAVEALGNVETWGLPALTTFLMNHCPTTSFGSKKKMALEVIEEMRKLPLGSNRDGNEDMEEEAERGGSSSSSSSAPACLLIESISRGFAHRSDMTTTLLKSIKNTTSSTSSSGGLTHHPPADVWLLACCAQALHHRPKVKSIFKSKANSGLFTPRLLKDALSGNGVALNSLFHTLTDLANGLLRSTMSFNNP